MFSDRLIVNLSFVAKSTTMIAAEVATAETTTEEAESSRTATTGQTAKEMNEKTLTTSQFSDGRRII